MDGLENENTSNIANIQPTRLAFSARRNCCGRASATTETIFGFASASIQWTKHAFLFRRDTRRLASIPSFPRAGRHLQLFGAIFLCSAHQHDASRIKSRPQQTRRDRPWRWAGAGTRAPCPAGRAPRRPRPGRARRAVRASWARRLCARWVMGVLLVGSAGTHPQKEDLLQSKIRSSHSYRCMYSLSKYRQICSASQVVSQDT